MKSISYCVSILSLLVCFFAITYSADAQLVTLSGTCNANVQLKMYTNGWTTPTLITCQSNGTFSIMLNYSDNDMYSIIQEDYSLTIVKSGNSNSGPVPMTGVNTVNTGISLYTYGNSNSGPAITNELLNLIHTGLANMNKFYVEDPAGNDFITAYTNGISPILRVHGKYTPGGNVLLPINYSFLNVVSGGDFQLGVYTLKTPSVNCDNGSICNFSNGTIEMMPTSTMGAYEIIIPAPTTIKNLKMVYNQNIGFSPIVTINKDITITGNLYLKGYDANDRLRVTNIKNIIMSGSATFSPANTAVYLDVQNSTVIDSSSGVTLPLLGDSGAAPYYSNDLGSTVGWFSTLIKGRAFMDEGGNGVPSGTKVRLLKNGVQVGSTVNTSNSPETGSYSFPPLAMALGDIITVHLDGGATTKKGATVTRSKGAAILNLDIYGDDLIIRDDDGDPVTVMTNQNLDTGNGGTNANLNYLYNDGGGNNLTTATQSGTLSRVYVWPGTVYTPGGIMNLGGDLKVMGTLNAGTYIHYLDGSFYVGGSGFYSAPGGTAELRFDNNFLQTYSNPNPINSKINLIKSSGSRLELLSGLNMSGQQLTVNNSSALATQCNNLSAGSLQNYGKVEVCGTETITVPSINTDAGTWWYIGNPDGVIKDFGAQDYYHLVLLPTTPNSINTFSLQNPLRVNGSLKISKSKLTTNNNSLDVNGDLWVGITPDNNGYYDDLDAGSSIINLAGDWIKESYGRLFGSSHIILDGTTQTIYRGTNFYKLTKNNGGTLKLQDGWFQGVIAPSGLNLSGTAGNPLSLTTLTGTGPDVGLINMQTGSSYGVIHDLNVAYNSLLVNGVAQSPALTALSGYSNSNINESVANSTSGWFEPPVIPHYVDGISISADPNSILPIGTTLVGLDIVFSGTSPVSDTCTVNANDPVGGLPVTYTFDSESMPLTEYLTDIEISGSTLPTVITATCSGLGTTSSIEIGSSGPVRGIPLFKNN